MRALLLCFLLAAPGLAGAESPFATPPSAGFGQSLPLPEEQAFQAETIADGANAIVRLTPAEGYYLYRHSFEVRSPDARLGALTTNLATTFDDPHFGRVGVFFSPAELTVPILSRRALRATVEVQFQGCQKNGICYPPMTRSLSVILPASAAPVVAGASTQPVGARHDAPQLLAPTLTTAATVTTARPATAMAIAEDERWARVLERRPVWQAWGVFAGLGLLLGLTPCVLPMVPILLGLVAGGAGGGRRAAGLAAVYVAAHAAVFATLGALAAWVGSGLQAYFQQPWAVLPVAGLMLLLGLVMLAGVPIQMPATVRAWAGRRGQGGSAWGAAGLGALSALVVGPCVAPPLAGAVLYLGQAGDPFLGAGALFALGLGMGAPLLVAAAGLGRWLPRSGPWASAIGWGFGAGFLALAGWMALRVWPGWAVAGVLGLGLLTLLWRQGTRFEAAPRWATGAMTAAVGMALVWQLSLGPAEPVTRPTFRALNLPGQWDAALAEARRGGKTVVLDFYADWCTACLDMEDSTFADPTVRAELTRASVVAVKADVTRNTPADRALMKRYGIIGPPATLFFRDGQEQRALRLVGAEPAPAFLTRLGQAWTKGATALQCPPVGLRAQRGEELSDGRNRPC